VDALGRSHLAVACEYGHAAVVKLLVERGANVNTTDGLGQTALHISSRQGQYAGSTARALRALRGLTPQYRHAINLVGCRSVECVQVLTAHGADVNLTDKEQCSPIFYAAMEGHRDCVRILLAAGARVRGTTPRGW